MRFKNEADLQKWLEQARSGTPKAAIKAASPEPRQLDPSVQRRILGVDTALRCTGWGIIDVRNGIMKAVDCGVIKNSSKEKVSDCLRRLSIGMRELVSLYKPDSAVMEGAFYFRNVHTALMLGSARGAVLAVLAEKGIDVHEYAPRRVKQSVCGFGNASKEQVAVLVSQFLKIQTAHIALDATDALAMAICHAQTLATAGGFAVPPEL